MAPASSIGGPFLTLVEAIRDHTAVDRTFGHPIKREGRTVVTAARVACGLGGGFGDGAEATNEEECAVEFGGSGGGGGRAKTRRLGVIEITGHETRFVPFSDYSNSARLNQFFSASAHLSPAPKLHWFSSETYLDTARESRPSRE